MVKAKRFLLLFVVISSCIFGICQAITEADIVARYQQRMREKELYDTNRFCDDPDCGKNVTQLITSKGYPCEDHYALTSDGYWLSLQRIPHGVTGNQTVGGKPVVFLQHGLLDASHTWVINMAYNSLGFILADAGFDVWMGNNRGNTYSRSNIYNNPSQSAFWDFSWDEMAEYDLPAMIDYVLEETGQDQLFYVGHSEGTIIGFSGFINTTLASKVKLFVALAPVAYTGDITSAVIQTMAALRLDVILETLGLDHFLVQSDLLAAFIDATCDIDYQICDNVMCAIMGCNPGNWNNSRWDVYGNLDPAGTSVQNMNHWGQGVRKDNFCMYDYGTGRQNDKKYGQRNPPCYDLSKMAAPVALFSGGIDALADPSDVSKLKSQLNPDVIVYTADISYYSHMDFVWGLDAYEVLYPQVISLINSML